MVEAWGLRSGGRQPSAAELATARTAVGLDALELRSATTLSRRRDNLLLEEGGFGKGAGLDRAVERLAATPGATSAVLDLGGQVIVWRAHALDGDPIENMRLIENPAKNFVLIMKDGKIYKNTLPR